MFFFEGYAIMFLTATPLAFFIVWNRDKLKPPTYMFYLALATLLASVFVFIGFVSVVLNV
jgi:hypothetical protein